MEATDRIAFRQIQAKKRRTWWCGAALVAIVIVLAVGLGVGLTHKNSAHTSDDSTSSGGGLETQILLPLYINPEGGTWNPLFEQLQAQPDVNFTVIVNPNNGPENSSVLDSTWMTTVERLNTFSNARPVGYIHTDYGSRPINEVLGDARVYAAWASAGFTNGTYAVQGVFYDQVTANRSTEGAINYSLMLDEYIKTMAGFSPRHLVIHNTAVIPSYFDNTTDITVVFEGTYAQYQIRKVQLTALSKSSRMNRAYLVHSVPTGLSKSAMKALVDDMSVDAGNLFVTDATENVYSTFGGTWANFVDAVASLN